MDQRGPPTWSIGPGSGVDGTKCAGAGFESLFAATAMPALTPPIARIAATPRATMLRWWVFCVEPLRASTVVVMVVPPADGCVPRTIISVHGTGGSANARTVRA